MSYCYGGEDGFFDSDRMEADELMASLEARARSERKAAKIALRAGFQALDRAAYDALSLEARRALLDDALELHRELNGMAEGTVRELLRRVGGFGNLPGYCDVLLAGIARKKGVQS